jgi:hypothetical protein
MVRLRSKAGLLCTIATLRERLPMAARVPGCLRTPPLTYRSRRRLLQSCGPTLEQGSLGARPFKECLSRMGSSAGYTRLVLAETTTLTRIRRCERWVQFAPAQKLAKLPAKSSRPQLARSIASSGMPHRASRKTFLSG